MEPENDAEKTADIYGIKEALDKAPVWPVDDPDDEKEERDQ